MCNVRSLLAACSSHKLSDFELVLSVRFLLAPMRLLPMAACSKEGQAWVPQTEGLSQRRLC